MIDDEEPISLICRELLKSTEKTGKSNLSQVPTTCEKIFSPRCTEMQVKTVVASFSRSARPGGGLGQQS